MGYHRTTKQLVEDLIKNGEIFISDETRASKFSRYIVEKEKRVFRYQTEYSPEGTKWVYLGN
ncbi:hypothetical protein SUNDANCE_178 [Brevibacillus phage Sundance]|uniref:hypothetical protein n=1 Tax=Brevibacillus phage Sundance TaxID=1691958 RepID=UPI0006BD41A6|nr:hypothetical protein AVT09_gp178 [Brevibacillus phage Sundance]ALA47994.1 hypothetical protein SUNDANCE_178 [Brevibacillus phage Sundance]